MSGRVDGVRLGSRVLHQIAGVLADGDVLTACGRTLDHTDRRFTLAAPEDVPIGRHCLGCWG